MPANLLLFSQICKFFFSIRPELCILKQKSRVRDWKEGAHGCAAHRRQWIGRADVLAFGKEIATVDTALLNRQSNSCLRSPQGLQILGDPIILNRRNGRRRNGVCQTPATAKKKKPDGIPRNGRKFSAQKEHSFIECSYRDLGR